MSSAVKIRTDFTAAELRRRASVSKHANQRRRLLSLAAVLDGKSREEAAQIGGMDRQTRRDWVHWFNADGPDCLKDHYSKGLPPRLTPEQLLALSTIVETRADLTKDGVVRWRRVDLKRVIEERFGVVDHERTVGKLLERIGFSHIGACPRHRGQKAETVAAFKKTSRRC